MNHEPSTLDTQPTPADHVDPVDQHIAGALRGRVPAPATDLDVVHRQVLEQSGRIRRRRTSVMAVGTTAVLVVGAWAALATRGGEPTVRLAEPELTTAPTITATTLPATTVTTAATVTTVTTAATIAQTVITTGNTVTTIDDSGNDSDDDGSAVTTGNTVTTNTTGNTVTTNPTGNTVTTNTSGNTVTTIDDSGNDSDDDGPAVTTGNTTATTTATTTGSSTTVAAGPAPFTQSYDSAGGSITVSWNGTSLSLQATNPQSGYTAEVEDVRSDRVKVRFRSEAGGDSRIEVRIEGSQATVDID